MSPHPLEDTVDGQPDRTVVLFGHKTLVGGGPGQPAAVRAPLPPWTLPRSSSERLWTVSLLMLSFFAFGLSLPAAAFGLFFILMLSFPASGLLLPLAALGLLSY